jgi:PAS domain S-box-containing protein
MRKTKQQPVRDELSTQARIISRLLQTFDLEQRLSTILDEAKALLQVEMGGIWLRSGEELHLRCWKGIPDDVRARLIALQAQDELLWLRKFTLLHEPLSQQGHIPHFFKETGIQTVVSIPLTIVEPASGKTEWLGTLVLASRFLGALDEDKVDTMKALAEQLSLAIDHSMRFHQASQRLMRLNVLHEVDSGIIDGLSITEILAAVVQGVPRELGADAIAISLFSPDRAKTQVCLMRLPNGAVIEKEAFSLSDSLLHWFIERQEPVIIYDLSVDPRLQMHGRLIRRYKLTSYLGMALVAEGSTIGILHILTTQPRIFAAEDIDFFQMLAGQTAIAIRSAMLLEETRRARQRYQGILDNMLEGCQIIGYDWRYLYLNDSAARHGRRRKEDLLGRTMMEMYPGIEDTPMFSALKQCIENRTPRRLENEFIFPDGSVGHFDLSIQPVPEGIFILSIDVTKQRQAETERERLHSQLVQAQHIAGLGSWDWDVSRNELHWSDETYRILGLTPGEAVTYQSFLGYVHPDDTELVSQATNAALYGDRSYDIEHRIMRPEGTQRVVHEKAEVIYDERGQPLQIVGIVQDMTEQRQMQEQLIAQERLASIGQLVSGVAHEINNPLTSIIGFSELVLNRDLPDDVRADLQIVNTEAKRAAVIVKNLLTFARKQPSGKASVNINESIQKVLDLRAHAHRASNIQVDVCFASDLPEITGNDSQLQQVFFNIVINAEFFMLQAHGKGNLSIATERAGDVVRCSFTDDGPGISEENLKMLFTPFHTTKEVGKGTGLGLSICHGIIAEHGGRIWAESELGKGAAFIIELPAAAATNTQRN